MRRILPARVLSLVLVSVVLAALATVLSWPSAPPGPRVTPIAEAPDTATAKQAAMLQGSPVEVADKRTETRTLYANPNGTMTAEYAVQPVRVRQGDRWVPFNTTLTQRPDGSIAPTASDVDLTVSGGGNAPLVRIAKDGKEISLSWSGPLPVPTVSGNTATYAEVLSGVDLVVRAEPSTAVQYLVVKNAEAARNPALARVRMGMRATGVKVTVTGDGGLEARDPANDLIFAAAPSAMWDSATPAHRSVAGVEVDDQSLTVIPDQKLLTDPATQFPVTVDPDLHTWNWWGWTSVLSGSDTPRWNCSAANCSEAQVGYCYSVWVGPSCNGIGHGRSYFQFNTHDGLLNGTRVLGGALQTVVVHSPDCNGNAYPHELFHTAGHIDSLTKWSNAPQGGRIATVAPPKVNGEHGCGGWKGMGFPVPAGEINRADPATYFIKASDESHTENGAYWWRKYQASETKLRVDFNHTPNNPYNLATDPPLPAPCTYCGGLPWLGQGTITLKTTLSDPDNDWVRPKWRVAADGVEIASWDGAYQASGANHDAPINLQNGKRFNWWVHAEDSNDVSGAAQGPSAWMVDTIGISQKPKIIGSLYLQDNRWHGGVGVPGTFKFEWAEDPTDPNADNDIDHYLYDTVDPPTNAGKVNAEGGLGGPATITYTPTVDGPQDLFVWAVDRAGHRSPKQTFHFYVRAGNGALAQYPFEGNAKDTAYLGDRHGTVNGTVTYGPGAVSSAIQLNGQPGSHVSAPNAVRTDTSYSVSAWVKAEPDRTGQVMGAVSQDGNRQSGFFLSYRGDLNKWRFMVPHTDTDNAPATAADSPGSPQLGVWTHLTGVYDRQANRIRLYVNGVLASEQIYRGLIPPNTTGPLAIGRQECNGNTTCDPWRGGIDEVQVYDRVLSAAEVRAMVSRDNVAVGNWKFDETEGTTARNEVDGGASLVLSGGASFTGRTGGAVHGGVQFNGSTGQAAAGGPVVRTDQSFTVTAWVKPDRFVTGTHMTAVSQEGAYNSGFSLQYNSGHQKWLFLETTADGPTYSYVGAVASQQPAANDWTHLAGVYDAAARELRIYVNGQFGGSNTWATPWNATGPLIVGRGKWQGGPSEFWPGAVDEVRAYNRTLSEEEIRGLVVRGNVTVGNWKLDGNADDSSGRPTPLNGTINGPVDWTGGQTSVPAPGDLAVRLSGSSHISAGHALDVDRGFSVAAWARLDVVGGTAKQTVVSQDGSQVSSFKLRATPEGRWSFAMFGADSGSGGSKDEVIGGAVQAGIWTHLVGVHDPSSRQISLYINGELAATGPHTQTWNHPTGGLQIGRAKSSGSPTEYFPGAIDDVTAYSRILFAEEIQTMAGRDLSLVHNWALDEPSGTIVGDSVGARGGTITGATHVVGKLGNALHFNGTDSSASTSGVDVNTAKSFTVAGWVHLDHTCELATDCQFTAISLDGGSTSKFRLGHMTDQDNNPFGAWVFEMPESDGRVIKAAVSGIESDIDNWVHLVGVYDAQARQIWIYVNGNRQGDGAIEAPWAASGGLQLGRSRVDGANAEYWPGEVDDVRLYSGALDVSRIENLVAMYPVHGGGTPTVPTDPVGYWKFDDAPGGTVAADSSGGRPATLSGGATFSGWYLGLNGTSAYAQTAGPVLDTSRSFSVATWVYMELNGSSPRTIVAQDGNRVSTFLLQYRPNIGKWTVTVPNADTDNPTSVVLASNEPAALGDWQHVAVVYDATPQQLRLYVNGVLTAVQVGVRILNGTGPLSIGRGKWNGGNADYFANAIDEVRAFGRALSDGEVRMVHDDRGPSIHGSYQFDDGTARDRTSRANHLTLSGGTSFVSGISGKALQLNGTSGSGTATWAGTSMRDSFTVSAWAKLTSKDHDSTVLGQDGLRMSGLVLQYKRSYDRWVFGGPTQDADGAPFMLVDGGSPAALNQWVHLAGVYDYAARQLRLYVNGTLAGSKENVRLFAVGGPLSVGRGKYNGQPADFFAGAIDDVITDKWMASADDIAQRAGYPKPPPGELGRFVNDATGARYTAKTDDPIRDGYRFERSLGARVAAGTNTQMLYSCLSGVDVFTAADCGSATKVADIGLVYTVAPTNLPTLPLYLCQSASDIFDSLTSDCDGATRVTTLGHVRAYALLARYYSPTSFDHLSTTYDAEPGYRYEGPQGWVSKLTSAGTTPLIACREGSDYFLSIDAACEGKTVLGTTGHVWTSAPAEAVSTAPLMRCVYNGQRFIALVANCEGQQVDRQLGYVMNTSLPTTAPQFP